MGTRSKVTVNGQVRHPLERQQKRRTIYFKSMPVPSGAYGQQAPSCFDRVKIGFMMGCCVGAASGALFGGFSALRFGLRGRELVSTIGKSMFQGGGTFGTFMAIGTGIRC